jgi:glycosyltransferase involved in cell wall biosynthesis
MPKKLTVVTVTFNAENALERTIQSVISQTLFSEIEYIVIDGGSKDKTLEIIKKYQNYLAYWVSEKDKGIYDAMNKGIGKASGEWINFMNAGDVFVDEEVVENVMKQSIGNADIVYGDYIIVYQTFKKKIYAPNRLENAFDLYMPLNHQSTFIKTEVAKTHPYSLDYRIGSDYEQILSFFVAGKVFKHLAIFIAAFADGGLSSTNKIIYHQEQYKIAQKYGLSISENRLKKVILREKFLNLLRKFLPRTIFERLMQIKNFFVK